MKDLGIFWEEPSLFVTGFSARAAGRAVIKGSGLEKRAVLILLPYLFVLGHRALVEKVLYNVDGSFCSYIHSPPTSQSHGGSSTKEYTSTNLLYNRLGP
jgi:hypothetical protein